MLAVYLLNILCMSLSAEEQQSDYIRHTGGYGKRLGVLGKGEFMSAD